MPAERGAGGDITEDAALAGRLRLRQKRKGHRFGHDAILLAACVAARTGECAIDLGAGIGAAGLALARRIDGVSVVLVERDRTLARLAQDNAALNGLDGRVRALALDVEAPARAFAAAGLAPECADWVLANPPFNDALRTQSSPDARRHLAHAASPSLLPAWIKAAARLLRPNGALVLIWRADGLADLLAALPKGFGGIEILPVHPRADAPAIRIVVRARKGSRSPLAIHPALVLNDEAGRPTKAADAVLREGAALMPDCFRPVRRARAADKA